ncbi:MAG: filamentous hemagglutinin N-terminal domain-containing protein, partial [Betaproteobacteria bacterium]
MARSSVFKTKVIAASLAAGFAGVSLANPVAPTVVAGQAVFQQSGKTLTVTNTPGAIINWQSFNIDRGELTRFIQQSASSQVLNRVTGVDPSVILGSLQSNGRVILINPNGIAFGKDAQVDVAGLMVSTLQLKDADFLAGRYKFNDTPGAGNIKNEGTIRTATGGSVILIAPKVENSGLIQTPEGQIMLAAGKSVTIADPDKPAIQVEITNNEHQAINLGTLIGKEVSLYGGLVKNSGTIQATTAMVGQNGKIRLQAKNDVENTGTLQANGAQGGDILIQAQIGAAVVQGVVEAKGIASQAELAANRALPEMGKGGRIDILAPTIRVDAVVDTSGSFGGGAILIGGDYQGGAKPVPVDWSQNTALNRASLSLNNPYAGSPSLTATPASASTSYPADPNQQTGGTSQNNPLLPNPVLPRARSTSIGANARIRSDALDDGDGGVVVAWSDGTTTAQGNFSARGGANGGNGGLTEVSGLVGIDVTGHADLSASNGHSGTMLLDPGSLTISTGTTNAATGILNNGWVSGQLAGSNLILATTDDGYTANNATQDITVSAPLSWNSANTLTLNAGRNIALNDNVTVTGGGGLTLNAGQGTTGTSSASNAKTIDLGGGALAFAKGLSVSNNSVLKNLVATSLDATTITVPDRHSVTLSGVTLGANLTATGTVTIPDTLTLTNGAEITLSSGMCGNWCDYIGELKFTGSAMTPSLLANGAGGSVLLSSNHPSYTSLVQATTSGATLTIGSGITIHGSGGGTVGNVSQGLINNGVINADTGGTLTVTGSNWSNSATGVIRATSGTLNLAGTNWQNLGTIAVSGGTLNLASAVTTAQFGTVSRTGGTVTLSSVWTNPGTYDLAAAGNLGSINLSGGQIIGGTVTSSNAGVGLTVPYRSNGTLSGVTLGANLTAIGTVTIPDTLTLTNGAEIT